ncbi:iron-sulfur flavoprotein [Methanosarcina siciliae C2J]|uniref:Iron-sulfur flavoprotein n=1 Tax=Methanosarcina siciliae C2J TaxID=1434118 RepID=A0A0E3PPG2_9EURY|nr:hypothetical protein [Methanosarcina siciliae]AKB36447.1 iron-sulfur flavoprotein [Methanosarcina siciliae C2J]
MIKDLKILGVGGSPRKNGNTDVLLESFLKGAESADRDLHQVP